MPADADRADGGPGAADAPRRPSVEEVVLDDLEEFDRLLEHRVRLAICVLLTRHERLSFPRFKELTGETDGSLGAHLRRLEDAEYVSVKKAFAGRKPVTWYSLTAQGRAALERHLTAVQKLIDGAAT